MESDSSLSAFESSNESVKSLPSQLRIQRKSKSLSSIANETLSGQFLSSFKVNFKEKSMR
jgi:hypothetical protein